MKMQNHKILPLHRELMKAVIGMPSTLEVDWILEKGPSASIPHFAL